MSKHYITKYALCPYYVQEDRQLIYCKSFREFSLIHLAFATCPDAKAYKKVYCRSCNYDKCEIYRMLNKCEEENGEN